MRDLKKEAPVRASDRRYLCGKHFTGRLKCLFCRRCYKPLQKMPAAERYIAFVSAKKNLFSFAHDVPVFYAGIALGARPAPADSRDLLDHIGKLKQPEGSGEELLLEIRAQSVADDRNV